MTERKGGGKKDRNKASFGRGAAGKKWEGKPSPARPKEAANSRGERARLRRRRRGGNLTSTNIERGREDNLQ